MVKGKVGCSQPPVLALDGSLRGNYIDPMEKLEFVSNTLTTSCVPVRMVDSGAAFGHESRAP